MEPRRVEPMPALTYAGSRLDRAGVRRRDEAWVASILADPRARALPLWKDQNLVDGLGGAPQDIRPAIRSPVGLATQGADTSLPWVFLGLDADVPLFAIDLDYTVDEERSTIAADAAFVDLRRVGSVLTGHDAALLAYARAMVIWHRRHRFCGVCGAPTVSRYAGHMRRCTNEQCLAETFPRTDPAVIMLVEHAPGGGRPPRCLLARHQRLPRAMYSTLAGFVEPGESLEETVVRESLEETGVHVTAVTYHGSQPWPFPASLMIGFRASASDDTILLDDDELEEARWFTAEEIASFGESDDEHAEFRLPRRDSIAHDLITRWVHDML